MKFLFRLNLTKNHITYNFLHTSVRLNKKMDLDNETCIAIAQLTSCNNKTKNLETVRNLANKAALKYGAQMLFLPEATDYIASNPTEMLFMAETLNGPTVNTIKEIALNLNLWISVGVHEKVQKIMADDEVYNTQILINNKGDMVASYRKLHLFDAQVGVKNGMNESSYIKPGSAIVPPIETPIGKLGMMICYDLRFPDTSNLLRDMGAEVITYPSAFTNHTGEAHWEPLLRARAIETQCYVVAAAQVGQHCAGRPISHGRALLVDPWGRIAASLPAYTDCEQPYAGEVISVNIQRRLLSEARTAMPVIAHRRLDVYAAARVRPADPSSADWQQDMPFADKTIPSATVFLRTPLSYAFTNIRCVVPGHVLVCSRRPVAKLTDLADHELQDLWCAAVRVQRTMEKLHGVSSSTLAVQDGDDAGRTVPHVHVHVLPRRPGDFTQNDDVYAALAQHDRSDTTMPIRNIEDMIAEAQLIKETMLQTST